MRDQSDIRSDRPDGRDCLSALFACRREADIAVEHLVQEHGIERGVIFVGPAGDSGTAGTRAAGADAAGATPGTPERKDAPLSGPLCLTVAVPDGDRAVITDTLREAGGRAIGARTG